MSLRYLSRTSSLLIVQAVVFGMGMRCADAATGKPAVETFVNQTIPVERPPAIAYPEGPLSSGSLTMEDVLSAHPRAKPKQPTLPATSGLMMSQGMKAVLQKFAVPPEAKNGGLSSRRLNAPEESAGASAPTSLTAETTTKTAKTAGIAYQPGQEPKTFGGGQAASASTTAGSGFASGQEPEAVNAETEQTASATDKGCTSNVDKWEKACGDAGYPANFVGKIKGETRTSCADGSLQDVWVTNTCAPPDAAQESPVKAEEEARVEEPVKAEEPAKTDVPAKVEPTSEPNAQNEEKTVTPSGKASEDEAEVKESSTVPVVSADEEGAAAEAASETKTEAEVKPEPKAEEAPATPDVPQPAVVPPSGDLCGAAAEIMAYEAPDKNLCRVGAASAVSGSGPWTWTCADNDGAVSSCTTLSLNPETVSPATPASAPVNPVNYLQMPAAPAKAAGETKPVCGSAAGQIARKAPSEDLCDSGNASAVRGANPWKWTCASGKLKVSCATAKTVDGKCGKAEGSAAMTAPAKNLCAAGAASSVKGRGPWTWTCAGAKGGNDASCSAPVAEKPVEKPVEATPAPEKPDVVPTPSKAFDAAPTPSPVPEVARVTGDKAPASTPSIPEGATPVPPPDVKEGLPTAPALKETSPSEPGIHAVNALTLGADVSTVLYGHEATTLDDKARATLDKLADVLQKTPGSRISLVAYADGKGSTPRAARRLSLTRALGIRDYLSAKGVPENRVDVHAEGASASAGPADRVDIKPNN